MSFAAALVRDYGDIDAEVAACRTGAALFDFSFMFRARVRNPGALAAIASITGRPLEDLPVGRIRYATRASTEGHLLSDLTIWRLESDVYDMMSGRREDVTDLIAASSSGAAQDLSERSAIYALQGPASLQALASVCAAEQLVTLPYYGSMQTAICGIDCLVGRLGYTGEPGFEIIADVRQKDALWSCLAGVARPAGFAAADVLRIEAGFVLFANEFRLPVTAQEAGLASFSAAAGTGPDHALELICFSADARECPVLWSPPTGAVLHRPAAPGEVCVTSACRSALCGRTLGLGYALRASPQSGRPLFDPAGTFTNLRRETRPFHDPLKLKPRAPWPPLRPPSRT